MRPKNTKASPTRAGGGSTTSTEMTREKYDWTDPYCPHCGSGKVFMLVVRLELVRELTIEELAQAMAAGVVIEDGNYFLQKIICCRDCGTTTKFTDPVESPWAPRPS